jgi:phosphate transport system substrate-binding protein
MYATLKQNNDMAVSPIVATLVLIVVAVIGAVAVGTIMGTFSTDVSKQANAGQASSASSAEILIAGSTTVQPASEALAKVYMAAHPGIKITVQGGGSGAGYTAANQGLVDIGSASSALDTTTYPALTQYTIGGSAVVVIAPNTGAAMNVTPLQLKNLYESGTPIGMYDHAIQRAENSGTEENFASFIGFADTDKQLKPCNKNVTTATGNSGVIAAVAGSTNTIGFTDFGMVGTKAQILGITTTDGDFIPTETKIIASLKGTTDAPATTYVTKLTRPLNYVVKGTPSSVVKNYIDFARSPGAMDTMTSVGYVPYVSFA